MRLMKAIPLGVLAGALLCSTALLAQHSTATPRIAANVDELSLTTLKGNVPRLAQAQFDQGEAASSTQLTHMRLVLSRSPEQQTALDAYLAQLQDKSSPNYHKWLTPDQFGQLYGPADSDIAALVAWLESHGLQVETVSKGRTNIAFNGTVSQVEQAFHTSIHSFQAGEQQFTSNTTDPQIPSALASVVKGVARLNTIRPKPHYSRASVGMLNSETRRLEPASASAPDLTLTSGGNFLYMVPGDAATIYNTPNSYNANFSSGTSYTGSGVKIGIGGDATINTSTVVNYRSVFLGNSTVPVLNYCTSSSSCSTTAGSGYASSTSADGQEAYIDTELSGGLAPGATIYYYASSDFYTGIEAAINLNIVDIFSLSFGACESDMGSDNAFINSWWQQAASQGIAVTVSTGDNGSAGCDDPNSQTTAKYGMQVSGYASTPYNIAVGGTNFYALTSSAFTTYASTTNSSSTYYRTALQYIPESTWNDSSQYDTTISANVPYTGSSAGIWAGSGGVSTKYSKPSWQTGTGVPADGMRDIPDVSLMGASGSDNAAWLVCDDESAGTGTANCATQSSGSFYFSAFGGTSTSAPAFAGILALVQQSVQSKTGCTGTSCRLGQAAQTLYELYNGSYTNSIFHDTTVGNISVACKSGTTNCALNSAGYYFESGYNTTTGYDLATGLGSVDVTKLLTYWSTSTGSNTATISVTVNTAQPVTTVEIVSVTVAVSGSHGTPTGTVTLAGGGYSSSSAALSSGSYTFSIPAGSLAIGTDTLTATYSGDSTYAATTNNSTSVTVAGMPATVTANPSASSISSNQTLTVTGTVSGSSGTPTGTVTLTGGGYTSSATALSSGSYSITIPANSLSAGSFTFTATYNGNSTYASATGTTTSVTVSAVTVLTPTVTVTPATGSVDSSQTYSVTVKVSGTSTLESSPTGTVTLTSGTYSSGAVTLGTSGCTAASCAITIPAYSLGAGSDTLLATYSGDSYYYSNTGTASVSVTTSIFALAATTPSSIAPGGTATSTITVSSSTLYSGTVALTCALTNYPSGAQYLPSCSNGSNTVTLSSGTTSGTATITVYTTAASAALAFPKLPGRGWAGAGGGAVLAFLLFLGIPARRRNWRLMLGVLVMMAALGSMAACGGGSTGSGSTGTSGTSAGTYTFTVTGTGNDSNTTTETTTFTVTVT
jgi:subtilase family serine protease